MWVPELLVESAREFFEEYPSVQVHSVDAFLQGKYTTRYTDTGLLKSVRHLYKRSGKARHYAAQKDLVSQLVIYEYGGYYFDTNTLFKSIPNLPVIGDIKVVLPTYCYNFVTPEYYGHHPWYPDVWAFAAVPGSPIMRNVLLKGIEVGNITKKHELTGNMYSGFFVDALKSVSPSEVKSKSFEKIESDHGWKVPELKLTKYHIGSWREYKNASEFLSMKGEVYKYLGLDLPPAAHLVDRLTAYKSIVKHERTKQAVNALINAIDGKPSELFPYYELYSSDEEILDILTEAVKLDICSEIAGRKISDPEDFIFSLDFVFL